MKAEFLKTIKQAALFPTRDLSRYRFVQLFHGLKDLPVACSRMLHTGEENNKKNMNLRNNSTTRSSQVIYYRDTDRWGSANADNFLPEI